MRWLVRSAIALASLLLFLVEPIAAKQLLPVFGGSAAVWITCLVFFQLLLLLGYLYAHALTLGAQRRERSYLHGLLLVAATASAVAWAAGWHPAHLTVREPVSGIFYALGLTLGLPFLLLGSTSPLLQVWLARREGGEVPYGLFGLSNAASLLALLAYPSLVEPHLALRTQRELWAGGVALFACISAAILFLLGGSEESLPETPISKTSWPPRRSMLLWFLLPMVASLQLSAVTAHLTANVAAIPLLWIAPLAVYLITFVLAFQLPRTLPRTPILGVLAVLLLSLGDFLTRPESALPIALGIGLFLAELFVACLFCHTELYKLRPEQSGVTWFYLLIAAGGVTGALLVAIVAPLLLRENYDLSLTFILTALIVLACLWNAEGRVRLLWGAMAAVLFWLCLSVHGALEQGTIVATRNFYGSLRVKQTLGLEGREMRSLMHGTIVHGTQSLSADLVHTPTTYYGRSSGIAAALEACCAARGRNIGVIGLGAGTLAAYGRPGDRMRFYEINPAVRPLAQSLFFYLRNSPAAITFVDGDARASLTGEPPNNFDVLVVDAFSGDAIPLHLLTLQAITVYQRHLAPGGILAFHVSNQFVDLEPELAQLASASGMSARRITSEGDPQQGELRATWILLSADDAVFGLVPLAPNSQRLLSAPGVQPWTDDYSSLLPLMRW